MADSVTGSGIAEPAAFGACCPVANERAGLQALPILWKRLVKDGETCDRCGGTYAELQRAVTRLREALRPLGIEPKLEAQELDAASFAAAPSESKRIWIAGRALEDWLGATVGSSPCCAACGDADCRTVEVGGRTFETIPEALIVRAALRAAAEIGGQRFGADAACCQPSHPGA